MSQYPPLQVFNEADEPVGEAMLEEILSEGLLHRVVHVVVENPEGGVLLQLRGPNVGTNPSTWDFAAAGYVDAGESYEQAARRELAEELGLSGFELQGLGVTREKETAGGNERNRFVGAFKVVIPSNTKFNIQKSEVARVKWFDTDGVKQLIASNSSGTTDYFRLWLQGHYLEHDNHSHQAAG